MTSFPLPTLQPVVALPTGLDRLGRPRFGPSPGGVTSPPNGFVEAQELALVRQLNAAANASPEAQQFTAYLAAHGGKDIWRDMAAQYRRRTGLVRGWAGTGLMWAAMGVATLRTQHAKYAYGRLRPYQVDPTIQLIGTQPRDPGYPSGHTSSAYAAATVLSVLWPGRAQEFAWWARQVGLSRVHAGAHFPSDVQAGAALGVQAGMDVASILA